METGLENQCEN